MAPETVCFQALQVCMYDRTVSLLTQYLISCLCEFSRFYNFGTVGDNANLLDFEVKRSRSRQEHKWSNRSPIIIMLGHILMKLLTAAHYHVHMTLMTFSSHGYKGESHRQLFWRWNTNQHIALSKTV